MQRQGHQKVDVVDGWHRLLPRNIHMLYNDPVKWRVWAATTNKLRARVHVQQQTLHQWKSLLISLLPYLHLSLF